MKVDNNGINCSCLDVMKYIYIYFRYITYLHWYCIFLIIC